ncbi:MAG: IclR family transcriptional regulator [Geobacteraceae bacterium]|nr:IclR family transcriptional regulator [Geobacteraceae bacterium]
MVKKEKADYIIQTVVHALDVLEQFRGDVDELGVTELSRRLRLHKNNVFRLLATLESHNYIEQNKHTENYRLGLKNLQLGQTVIRQMGLLRRARPVLESLTGECNETCYVAILKEAHVIYLDALESAHPVRVASRTGARLPLHCTAEGKVLLAGASDTARQRCSARELKRYTAHTVTDRQELEKELEMVAARGYALENEELDQGVRGVAVPIRNYTGCVVGALGVSGPATRFSEARIHDELVPLLLRAAAEVSGRLGYCPPADIAQNG